MARRLYLMVAITEEQRETLQLLANSEGFKSKSAYVRHKIFQKIPLRTTTNDSNISSEFEFQRGERRSFYCSNELWDKIQKMASDEASISQYIQKVIEEKLKTYNGSCVASTTNVLN